MNSARKLFEYLINRLMHVSGGGAKGTDVASHLEVERKFRLSEDELSHLPDTLGSLGFTACGQVIMTDTFLPTQIEGDMIRVRVELEKGKTRTLLTLKSWVATPDGGKERKETEREIASVTGRVLAAVGRWLKGTRLLSFSKHRQMFEGTLNGLQAVVSLDRVNKLGSYSGCYLEVEILVPVGTDVTPAREQIAAFVTKLLGEAREPVALSYMEMLKRSMQTPQVQ